MLINRTWLAVVLEKPVRHRLLLFLLLKQMTNTFQKSRSFIFRLVRTLKFGVTVLWQCLVIHKGSLRSILLHERRSHHVVVVQLGVLLLHLHSFDSFLLSQLGFLSLHISLVQLPLQLTLHRLLSNLHVWILLNWSLISTRHYRAWRITIKLLGRRRIIHRQVYLLRSIELRLCRIVTCTAFVKKTSKSSFNFLGLHAQHSRLLNSRRNIRWHYILL
jgi:hypothetical protein